MPHPEGDLQALLDEHAIREVLARYCRGVDRLDEELIRSCYHPAATDDHGLYKGPGGDAASVETYVVAHHSCERDDGPVLETAGARYVDRFERRDGVWKLADRVVLVDREKRERSERVFPAGTFRAGLRSREDLAYGGRA